MQLSLATEALSKCTGDVDGIRKKIRPTNGNRRQRMSEFLHFVLQDDINLIEFERMLRGNNLENIIGKKNFLPIFKITFANKIN